MEWEVEFTDEFEHWWNSLSEDEQEDVNAKGDSTAEIRADNAAPPFRRGGLVEALELEGIANSARGAALSRALRIRPSPLRDLTHRWGQDRE